MHKTKTDSVFDRIRAEIVAGELSPGDWIRPQDWTERLNMSSIPVREALGDSRRMGNCADSRIVGRASRCSEAHVAETYLIRMSLEALAAREAIRKLDETQFQGLVEDITAKTSEMIAILEADDGRSTRELNEDIHMTIYRASGMPRLVGLIESLWATYPFRRSWTTDRRTQVAEEHKKLLEILKERDADRLGEATAEHIRTSHETLASIALVDVP